MDRSMESAAAGEGQEAAPSDEVLVQASCPPDVIATLTPGDGFGRIVRPSRMQETFRHIAGRASGDVVLAYRRDGRILGYLLLDRPEPTVWQDRTFHERWEQCQAIWMLGSIEVSSSHRGEGVASRMLAAALEGGRYEERIVVAEGLRWHWDLTGAGLTAMAYRQRLMELLGHFGFQEFPTDEKEIRSDAANVLAVRVGSRVSPEHVRHFHALRYLSRRTLLRGTRKDGSDTRKEEPGAR